MFRLEKNEFTENGICKYKDGFGNTAFMKKTEDGFVAKLRFSNKNVSVEPLYISIPPKDGEDGVHMKMDLKNDQSDRTPDIVGGLNNFTALVQRWVQMMYDIKFMECPASYIKKANGDDITDEYIGAHKISIIGKHEEIKPLIYSVFPEFAKAN